MSHGSTADVGTPPAVERHGSASYRRLVAGESAVTRLTEYGLRVVSCVLTGTGAEQAGLGGGGQSEYVIEFAVGE